MSSRISNCVGVNEDHVKITAYTDLIGKTFMLWASVTDCESFREHCVTMGDDLGDYDEVSLEVNLTDFLEIMLKDGLRMSDYRGTIFKSFSSQEEVLDYFFQGKSPDFVWFAYS